MKTNTSLKLAGAILAGVLAIAALGTFYYASQTEGVPQFLSVLAAIGLSLAAFCVFRREDDLVHDFFLPVILFAALGGFSWAVRGSSGFGAVKGCVFAGVLWGAAWWFIARNPSGIQIRRYTSGWIVLALTIGIGLSGGRGWAQWHSFFSGQLQTNAGAGEFVEIAPFYGFVWLFIAGVPWAGIGACLLAWCASERPLAAWKWGVRLFCGFGMAYFLNHLYEQHPQWFLPLYSSIAERYNDLEANPNLGRLMRDNGHAIRHLGFYLGFLLFEVGRRDWRNVTLILTVGLINGFGWALCQNWYWAAHVFEGSFNWWRCWESSGGISIGIALGVAYYLVNRPLPPSVPLMAPAVHKSGPPWYGMISVIVLLVPLVWFLVEARNEVVSEITSLPGAVLTLFPIGHEGEEVRELFQLSHLAFALTLGAGVLLYAGHLWKSRKARQAASENPSVDAPVLSVWFPRFILLGLITFFMMGWIRTGEQSEATIWWARYDYWLAAAAGLYGLLYLLLYLFRSASTPRTPRVSSFIRYPNADWLATFLFLLIVAVALLQGELPAWRGWFGQMQEAPAHWYGLLGPAVLAVFAVFYYLSVAIPKRDTVLMDATEPVRMEPNLERLGVYLGLLVGLGMSLKNGARGWANIYLEGEEQTWGNLYWSYIGPVMLGLLVVIVLLVLFRRFPHRTERDIFPHAGYLMAFVLVWQNVIGQAITGPITNWNEMAFNIFYFLLFLMSAIILYHYHTAKKLGAWAGVAYDGPDLETYHGSGAAFEPMMARGPAAPVEETVLETEAQPGADPETEEIVIAAPPEDTEPEETPAEEATPEEPNAWTTAAPAEADPVVVPLSNPGDPLQEDSAAGQLSDSTLPTEEDTTGQLSESTLTPEEEITAQVPETTPAPEEDAPAQFADPVPVPAEESLDVSVMVDLDDVNQESAKPPSTEPVEDAGEEVLPGVPSPSDYDLDPMKVGDASPETLNGDEFTPAEESGQDQEPPPTETEREPHPDKDHEERDDPRF